MSGNYVCLFNLCNFFSVYLPAGLWQDGIDGSLRKGNRWMHEYRVPIDRVAYFLRKPDDMRF
jgi:myogenesis-regulating glycosidase